MALMANFELESSKNHIQIMITLGRIPISRGAPVVVVPNGMGTPRDCVVDSSTKVFLICL